MGTLMSKRRWDGMCLSDCDSRSAFIRRKYARRLSSRSPDSSPVLLPVPEEYGAHYQRVS